MAASPILLGVIGRPHGVRGHVHVHSYAAQPADLAAYGPLSDGSGRLYALRWVAAGIAELTDITAGNRALPDRAAAERLTNTKLFIDRAALPEPDEDEFYLTDLIGLDAFDPAGAPAGSVVAVHDYGAGPSLEIAGAAGATVLPFTRACVPAIDLAARRLTISPPHERVVEGAA